MTVVDVMTVVQVLIFTVVCDTHVDYIRLR